MFTKEELQMLETYVRANGVDDQVVRFMQSRLDSE